MARELSSILSELNNVYNPQRDIIKQQQSSIDPAMEAENNGLAAAKQDAFSQITDQSNRRGLFYSGIPIAEEQRYTGATYLPAVANLRSKYAQQRFNLQDSLNNIDLEQRKYGQGIYEGELARDEQKRQFDAQMAAQQAAAKASSAGSGWSPTDGSGVLGQYGASNAGGFGMSKKKDGGFAFVDSYGNPVSAAVYSQATGVNFRDLLTQMANQGDQGARQALGFVGNDYGYDPQKIHTNNNNQIYNSLAWGTGKSAPARPGVN
jgi:hypothetical protein